MRRPAALLALLLATPLAAQESVPTDRATQDALPALPQIAPSQLPLSGSFSLPGTASSTPTPPPQDDPNLDYAFASYQRGSYFSAMRLALQRIEKGKDPAAMTLVGVLNEGGLGVPQNLEAAAEWYRLAADAGDRPAMVALALMRLDGRGVERDRKIAADLFRRAAEAGDATAQYNLGLLHLEGAVVSRDRAEAERLFRLGAEAGNADAQYALSTMLRDNRGDRDPEEATKWLAAASAQDHPDAKVEYAIALFNGTGTEPDEQRAALLFRDAAEEGSVIAQNRLARLYSAGRGVERELVRAAAWHLVSRARGANDHMLDNLVNRLTPDERKRADALAARLGADPVLALDASALRRQ